MQRGLIVALMKIFCGVCDTSTPKFQLMPGKMYLVILTTDFLECWFFFFVSFCSLIPCLLLVPFYQVVSWKKLTWSFFVVQFLGIPIGCRGTRGTGYVLLSFERGKIIGSFKSVWASLPCVKSLTHNSGEAEGEGPVFSIQRLLFLGATRACSWCDGQGGLIG
jgi:hypothetical protein